MVVAGHVALALWHLLRRCTLRHVLGRGHTLSMAKRWSVSGRYLGKACSSLSRNFMSRAKRLFYVVLTVVPETLIADNNGHPMSRQSAIT